MQQELISSGEKEEVQNDEEEESVKSWVGHMQMFSVIRQRNI